MEIALGSINETSKSKLNGFIKNFVYYENMKIFLPT